MVFFIFLRLKFSPIFPHAALSVESRISWGWTFGCKYRKQIFWYKKDFDSFSSSKGHYIIPTVRFLYFLTLETVQMSRKQSI